MIALNPKSPFFSYCKSSGKSGEALCKSFALNELVRVNVCISPAAWVNPRFEPGPWCEEISEVIG